MYCLSVVVDDVGTVLAGFDRRDFDVRAIDAALEVVYRKLLVLEGVENCPKKEDTCIM